MVYVLDKDGNPLMPTAVHGKVRRMLKDDMLKEFSKPVRADRLKPIRNGRGCGLYSYMPPFRRAAFIPQHKGVGFQSQIL